MEDKNKTNEVSPVEQMTRNKDFEARVAEARIEIAKIFGKYNVDLKAVQRITPDQSALQAVLMYFDTKSYEPTQIIGSGLVDPQQNNKTKTDGKAKKTKK